MARSDPQINLRISAELKQRIEAAAAASKRSMNAEIADRLERSFDAVLSDEHIDIRKVAPEALDDAVEKAVRRVIETRPELFRDLAKDKR